MVLHDDEWRGKLRTFIHLTQDLFELASSIGRLESLVVVRDYFGPSRIATRRGMMTEDFSWGPASPMRDVGRVGELLLTLSTYIFPLPRAVGSDAPMKMEGYLRIGRRKSSSSS